METIAKTIEKFSTLYMYLLILGVAGFNIFLDCEALRKKKLKRDERISKYIGYVYVGVAATLFIVANFVL